MKNSFILSRRSAVLYRVSDSRSPYWTQPHTSVYRPAKTYISLILNFSHLLTDCILKINLKPISLLWVCACVLAYLQWHLLGGLSEDSLQEFLCVHVAEVGCLSFLLLCHVLLAGSFTPSEFYGVVDAQQHLRLLSGFLGWNSGGQAYIVSASAPWALSQPWL